MAGKCRRQLMVLYASQSFKYKKGLDSNSDGQFFWMWYFKPAGECPIMTRY
uniref:Uncharacterized protein n=1 Tax=Arion vulgaris TaxID=1028688 RepID=A0A0B7BYF4_9EUPU